MDMKLRVDWKLVCEMNCKGMFTNTVKLHTMSYYDWTLNTEPHNVKLWQIS